MKFKITRYDDKTRLQLIHYNNLRKYYYKLIEEIMGEDYYTISPDVMNSDTEAYEDMIYRIKYLKKNYYIQKQSNIFAIYNNCNYDDTVIFSKYACDILRD